MSGRFDFDGRVAVITGAASGIGAALARNLAGRGCHLALADVNKAGLDAVAQEVARPARKVTTAGVDVADAAQVAAFAEQVRADHGGAHLLINNAGVALGGTFEEIAPEDYDWLIGINFRGVVSMTRAFLPLLRAADRAHIANVSSIFGIIAPAGQSAYSAAKFAVRGFSDALRHELAGSSIGVTTVHPGGVNTAIAASARFPKGAGETARAKAVRRAQTALVMPPERAAEIIVRAIERAKPRVLVGRDAQAAALMERLSPAGYWSVIGKRFGAR